MSTKSTKPSPEPSTGELLAAFSEQASELVRQEVRLAQAELKQKGRGLGAGAGMLGGSGALVFYGVAVLLAGAVLGLAEVLPAWAAAATVGVLLLLIAALVAIAGKKQIAEAVPPTPERTIDSIHRDVAALRRHQ